MTATDYDTKEGIENYLKDDLTGLNRLVADRIEAGYRRKEQLHDFVIMGAWHADSCGNFNRITKPDLRQTGKRIPDVLTWQEVWKFADGITTNLEDSKVPPPHVECPICQKKWTLSNSFDVQTWKEELVVPIPEFVGEPFALVTAAYSIKTDAVYRSSESFVRNDKYIDLDPMEKYPSLKKNPKGFVGKHEGYEQKDYIVGKGDEAYFHVFKFFHRKCKVEHLKRVFVKHYKEILEAAGIGGKLRPIPNGYCSDDTCCGPWVWIETAFGDVRIGWRKNVINIDYPSLLKVDFTAESVTQGDGYIHAWGKEKCVEYLSKIRTAGLSTLDGVAAGADGITVLES